MVRMEVRIGPLEADAVAFVAARMRAADRAEIFATRSDGDASRIAAETMAYARVGCVASWVGEGWDVEPVAVVCAIPLWPGVWSVGMYATDRWPLVARRVTRWIARSLMPDLVAAGAHWAECRSLETHATAHRWLERLGAHHEATLAAYGRGGETFFLYAWTRPCPSAPTTPFTSMPSISIWETDRCASDRLRRLHRPHPLRPRPPRTMPTCRRPPPPSASGFSAPAAAPRRS